MSSGAVLFRRSDHVLTARVIRDFFLFVVLAYSLALPSRSLPQDAGDPMLAHYDGAHAALRSGDQDRATVEYRGFLADAIRRIANARARIADLVSADQNFQEALSFANNDSSLRLDYASFLFDSERLAEAHSMAKSALDFDPRNARGEVLLGRISFQERQYSEAATHLNAAAGKGEFSQVWRLLGLSYLRVQQLNLAQPVLEKALRVLGESAENRVLIATVYYYGDYPDLAIKELRKALAQDPHAPDAHYYLGLAYLGNNEEVGYPDAVPEFETQLKETPRDFRSRYMLGYIALQQHQMEKAERELLQARQTNPDDVGTRLLLGQLFSETGRITPATDMLRSIISDSQGRRATFITVRAHYMLGRLLQQSGKTRESADEIEIAERMRQQLRAGSIETYSRTSTVVAEQRASVASQWTQPVPRVSPEERARANMFVEQIGPLIGEAYYNLARISAFHQDQITASRYSARAVAWDPSLASAAGR